MYDYFVSYPCLIIPESNPCNVLADIKVVVRGIICRNNNIIVVNSGQGFSNTRIVEYRC